MWRVGKRGGREIGERGNSGNDKEERLVSLESLEVFLFKRCFSTLSCFALSTVVNKITE